MINFARLSLAIATVSIINFPALSAEKEYVIDFSSNSAGISTSYPSAETEMPVDYDLGNGLTFSIENQGVRYNANNGYNCLQISNANSGAKMYGCFSIAVSGNSKITFVDFVGLDEDDSRNCRDLLSGPYTNAEESGAENMTGAWSDETGMSQVFFRYGYNPAAVGSAFIKKIILHITSDTQQPDPGTEDPKPDPGTEDPKPDPGTEDPKPDPGTEDPEPAVATNIIKPVLGVLSHTYTPGQSASFMIAEDNTFTFGLYEYNPAEKDYQYHAIDMPDCFVTVTNEDGNIVTDAFEITQKDDAYFRSQSECAGKYEIILEWPDSEAYSKGKAKMMAEVYLPVSINTLDGNVSVTVVGDNNETIMPEFDVYRESLVLLDPRNDKSGDMRINISTNDASNFSVFYLVETFDEAYNHNLPSECNETQSDMLLLENNTCLTLPGSKGIVSIAIKKNNVLSPVEKFYYAKSMQHLTGQNVGISNATMSDTDGYELYNLTGERVSEENATGFVIRRSNNSSSLIIIKR